MEAAILAILYGAQKPISFKKLAEYVSASESDIESSIRRINEDEARAPWYISIVGKSAQLAVRNDYTEYAHAVAKKTAQSELTPAAAETVSIIAYRGPIHRDDLEHIRGVHCGHAIRILRIKGLIDEIETDVFHITHTALHHLGIRSVQDLPEYEKYGAHVSLDDIV